MYISSGRRDCIGSYVCSSAYNRLSANKVSLPANLCSALQRSESKQTFWRSVAVRSISAAKMQTDPFIRQKPKTIYLEERENKVTLLKIWLLRIINYLQLTPFWSFLISLIFFTSAYRGFFFKNNLFNLLFKNF